MQVPEESTGGRVRGKREVKAFALDTVSLLERFGLGEEIDELQARVFARNSDVLFETQCAGGEWHLTFKPMVELLLREIRSAATAPMCSLDERRRRIRWALDATGF